MIAAMLEQEALAFARGEAVAMEARLAQLGEAAIAGRRIDEAIFWQRVTFRSRMIRAIGGRAMTVEAEKDRRSC